MKKKQRTVKRKQQKRNRQPVTVTQEQIDDASELHPIVIETHGDPEYEKENPLGKPKADVNYWRKRAMDAEELLSKAIDERDTLKKGQMLSADQAAPMEIQKMKEQIYELQERLQPYRYECVYQNALISMMIRPRTREVIIL